MKTRNPYYRPDVVLLCGQSNVMGYAPNGDPVPTYPQRQYCDRNSLLCSNGNYRDLTNGIDTTWQNPTLWYWSFYTLGLGQSLCAKMLDRGLCPAVIQTCHGGTPSDWWPTNATGYCSFITSRLAQLTQPNVRCAIMYMGETDVISGAPTSGNWQTNTASFVASVRAAVGLPTLPWIIVKIPTESPFGTGGAAANLATVRGYQDALVAADAHMSAIDQTGLTYWSDNIHNDWPTTERLAQMICNKIP